MPHRKQTKKKKKQINNRRKCVLSGDHFNFPVKNDIEEHRGTIIKYKLEKIPRIIDDFFSPLCSSSSYFSSKFDLSLKFPCKSVASHNKKRASLFDKIQHFSVIKN